MVETKKYGWGVKAAVLSVAILMYTTSMSTPALGEIQKAFPDVSAVTIQQISSIPSLMLVLFSFIAGQLARVISSKKILYIAMIFLIIGGIAPAIGGGITAILFSRYIFGAGYGLVFPMSSAVVQEFFSGLERDSLMGYKSAVGALSGVFFQMFGGFVAVMNWRWSFLGILVVIPIFILILLKLPNSEIKKADKDASKGKLTPTTYGICIFNVFFNILQFSFMINIAMVLTNSGGNAGQAGTILTTFTVAATIAGLLYGRVIKILRRYTLSLAIGLLSIAFFVLINAVSFTTFIVGGFIFGLGFGFYNPTMTINVMNSAPGASTLAVSTYVSVQGIGQYFSPMILAAITGALGLTLGVGAWTIAAWVFSVICIGSVVFFTLYKSKNSSESA
ncbi:MFS transporter [Alkalibaculum sp. M08DMB]|uniref:MFS transporter n=1 Tax=Alkalibaculum sporogenes TaxID=2655001 RepID=A0A6A7K4E8_9FIRM|nr:MFS transporter [Alkalibaculum sporogenes]MPW24336.1 MFS transporter [Alkalibaculum sporogenes]